MWRVINKTNESKKLEVRQDNVHILKPGESVIVKQFPAGFSSDAFSIEEISKEEKNKVKIIEKPEKIEKIEKIKKTKLEVE